ncbi:MAG: winged helix-turn-helix domain-containing protein, partial [Candidatus Micrarchaeota archaeon]
IAVCLLFYNNVLTFTSVLSTQQGEFEPTPGPPLLSSGTGDQQDEKAAIQEDADVLRSTAPEIAPLGAPAAAKAFKTETVQEKGVLQDPAIYYGAIALLGLMLVTNIFKVSFQSSAVFDSDIFKTLSSETRVEMLYSLQQRRKTLSELAAGSNISLPGAKQHLELLESKGLVKKMDEGRKWKYYELTSQGRSIIAERFA